MGSIQEQYVLEKATIADAPGLYEVWRAAFEPAQKHRIMFFGPDVNEEARRAWHRKHVSSALKKPNLTTYKITDTSTGQIAAAARWWLPPGKAVKHEDVRDEKQKKEDEIEAEEVKAGVPGMRLDVLRDIEGTLDTWREKNVDAEETYVLYSLHTHPDHQRKGLASRLLRVALDQADAEGRRAFLEATMAGLPAYSKAGFKEVDRFTWDFEKYGGELATGEKDYTVLMFKEPAKVIV